MSSPRKITVKMLLSVDEYVEFNAACDVADTKHSPQLRRLVKGWIAQPKNKRGSIEKEGPAMGHPMAMSLPGRINYGARMRC